MHLVAPGLARPRALFALRVVVAVLGLSAVAFFTIVWAASAADGQPPAGETIVGLPVWPILVGLLTTAGAYVVNHFAFWGSEPAKAVFQLVVAAVTGAVTQLIDAGTVGFDSATGKYVLAAVLAMLLAHFGIWRPGAVNVALGAGRNHG